MEHKILDQTLTIFLEGSITSSNSEEVTAQINQIKEENAHEALVIDLEQITYISSAGLRMFLTLKKQEQDFKIINANSDVYEVFQMTGFTEIMDVSKALKVVSIEGKELIGQGYMGKVFRIDDDTIIKVNYRVTSIDDIQRERELAKKAFVLGVPTAISFDVVKVKEGGFGSMFELLKSDSLCNLIAKNPDKLDEYINIYFDLLKKINSAEDLAESLPDKKLEALSWVEDLRKTDVFTVEVLDRMEQLIKNVPDCNNVIHGDCHVKNIMMQNDEALLIDMDTLGRGHPLFELTPMFLTYHGYGATEPGNLKEFLGIDDEIGFKIYRDILTKYFQDRPEVNIDDVFNKCALLGYMWLAQKTITFEKENVVRLNHAVEQVNKLINLVDSLSF